MRFVRATYFSTSKNVTTPHTILFCIRRVWDNLNQHLKKKDKLNSWPWPLLSNLRKHPLQRKLWNPAYKRPHYKYIHSNISWHRTSIKRFVLYSNNSLQNKHIPLATFLLLRAFPKDNSPKHNPPKRELALNGIWECKSHVLQTFSLLFRLSNFPHPHNVLPFKNWELSSIHLDDIETRDTKYETKKDEWT